MGKRYYVTCNDYPSSHYEEDCTDLPTESVANHIAWCRNQVDKSQQTGIHHVVREYDDGELYFDAREISEKEREFLRLFGGVQQSGAEEQETPIGTDGKAVASPRGKGSDEPVE